MQSLPHSLFETPSKLIHACKKAADIDLIFSSSGNFSVQINPTTMLITESGSALGTIRSNQLASINLYTGKIISGKPSSEWKFHHGLYQKRIDIKTVFHFQSTYATIIACSKDHPNFNIIPEIPAYVDPIVFIPYRTPGSDELATEVIKAMASGAFMGIIENHGLVTVGYTVEDVLRRAVFFELACKILVLGNNIGTISDDECLKIRKKIA